MDITAKINLPIDIPVQGTCKEGCDPYSVALYGIFTNENKIERKIPGFYKGNQTWCVRFSGDKEENVTYRIISDSLKDSNLPSGTVKVKGREEGVTKQLFVKEACFVDADGKEVFLMGYECDFLFSLFASPNGSGKTQTLINNLKHGGFNKIVMNVYAYDLEFNPGRTCEDDYGPPYIEMWEEDQNGARRLKEAFFLNMDRLMDLLYENGMYVELYFKVYNKSVPWPERYSEEERQYITMVTARYQAYPNVFWNFTKEGYFEKDKNYIYHNLCLIRELDAYHHLCTIHDDLEYALNEKYRDTIDYLTLQQQGEMSHACLYYGLRSGKPVVNGEFGNECGEYGVLDTPAWKSYSPEDNARFAFQSVMAGAYVTYYSAYGAWDVIQYDRVPKGFQYFRHLRQYFQKRDFAAYHPAPELCAWSGLCLVGNSADENGQKEMIVYVEPKEERLYLLYWTGEAHLNPKAGRKILSVTRTGMFSGKEEQIPVESVIETQGEYKNGSMILRCLNQEPCMFAVRYLERLD